MLFRALFRINLVYWSEAGYFDTSAYNKWFLHTWSLSVEWQFYLLYPLLLIAINRYFGPKSFFLCLFLLAVTSFLFSCFSTNIDSNASYYLLPTRAWEMLLGALAYEVRVSRTQKIQRATSTFGLFLIVISVFSFSKDTPWPSFDTLLPSLGTYLVLVSNRQSGAICENKVIQFIGSSSYSTYLWHWPIVVIITSLNFGPFGYIISLILSFSLGALSYFMIEKPSNFLTVRKAVLSFIIITGAFTLLNSARFRQFSEVWVSIEQTTERKKIQCYTFKGNICKYQPNENNLSFAVIGDSHATMFHPVLST